VPMTEGDDDHIRGFILHKLCVLGCYSRSGRHSKHIPKRHLASGYSKKYRGKFDKIIKDLKKRGVILIFRARTGRDTEDHVCLEFTRLEECRSIINAYRKSVGLHSLNERFEEKF